MPTRMTRRDFIATAAPVVAVSAAAAVRAQAQPSKTIKIIGICCSPRKNKTSAAGLRICLDSAKELSPNVEVELIELAGLKIDGALAAGVQLEPGQQDDFPKVQAKLVEPNIAGVIIGTPLYFGNMSSLCKAFLERCIAFRREWQLRNKVGGCLVVGGSRNGGHENTIQSVHSALFGQDMILVGDGRPHAHLGATLWNNGDDISKDEWGLSTARNLGKRVAEVALRLAGLSAA